MDRSRSARSAGGGEVTARKKPAKKRSVTAYAFAYRSERGGHRWYLSVNTNRGDLISARNYMVCYPTSWPAIGPIVKVEVPR
jgi:hypothetical protein